LVEEQLHARIFAVQPLAARRHRVGNVDAARGVLFDADFAQVIGLVEEDGVHWPAGMEGWLGNSRAYWEGKTLVIETTNIKSGDSVSHDLSGRSAAPVIVTMVGGAPRNTIPTSKKAHAVEKLTMTGPNAILYEITYDDPDTFTAPWTAQLEWSRDDSYMMPEYACHEGNVQLRNYVSASRAVRAAKAKGELKEFRDGNERFERPFDVDPVAPRPAAASPAPAPAAPPAAK
jgi:hypothetical protein